MMQQDKKLNQSLIIHIFLKKQKQMEIDGKNMCILLIYMLAILKVYIMMKMIT